MYYYKEHQYYINNNELLATDIFGNLNVINSNFKILNNMKLFPYSNNKIEIQNNNIIQNKLINTNNIKGNKIDNLNAEKIYNFLIKNFKILPNLNWYLFKIEHILYLSMSNNNKIYILNKSEKNNLTEQIKEIYNYNNDTNNSWEVIECEPYMNQSNILSFENNKFIGSQNGIIKI